MKNILIAPDKFKGSLSAREVCSAITEGILQKDKSLNIRSIPLADGGEGTCEVLTDIHKGALISVEVNNPLFEPVMATYGTSADGRTAFIEMASASGLQLLSPDKRNPAKTSSFGTGELIRHALDNNVKKIILGIGGSATNDAGIGMASALGYSFIDKAGKALTPTGENLVHLCEVKSVAVHPRLRNVEFITLCDVTNPLYGKDGAAYVYGPQKGADTDTVKMLDAGLRNFERVIKPSVQTEVNFEGAGAAGGMGAGARIFLNAAMVSGINHVIEATGLEEKIANADLVITGEGKLDKQSLSGKVVFAVGRLAKKHGKSMIIVCGKNELSAEEISEADFSEVISLVDDSTTPSEAMYNAYALIVESMKKRKILTSG